MGEFEPTAEDILAAGDYMDAQELPKVILAIPGVLVNG